MAPLEKRTSKEFSFFVSRRETLSYLLIVSTKMSRFSLSCTRINNLLYDNRKCYPARLVVFEAEGATVEADDLA